MLIKAIVLIINKKYINFMLSIILYRNFQLEFGINTDYNS